MRLAWTFPEKGQAISWAIGPRGFQASSRPDHAPRYGGVLYREITDAESARSEAVTTLEDFL